MNVTYLRRIGTGIAACILGAVMAAGITYLIRVHEINKAYAGRYHTDSPVALRKFPFPYRAAMAISSDIDNTGTLQEFIEINRFINTEEMTADMGTGIGLDIGNSFFFYEPRAGTIGYFSKDPQISETIRRYVKAGYIDFLHSYGEKENFTREDAVRALTELKNTSCRLDVWIDHAKSKSNLGDDVTFGLGDHPRSKEYHADLTLAYGIRFAWLGRVTMITGQSVPVAPGAFLDLFDADHPIPSVVNIGKEFAKNVLGVLGNKKYALHRGNELVKITRLDDGQKLYEFMRFDNGWRGVGTGADARGLAQSVSSKVIARLKQKHGYMIVYTHLGKNGDSLPFIPAETQKALRNLAAEFKAGNIYITTTSGLLNYYIHQRYLDWTYKSENGETIIQIQGIKDPLKGDFVPRIEDLQGITFYVPDKIKARILLSGKELENIRRNSPDYTGRPSVTIAPAYFRDFSKKSLN
jgi:hypothetical protein